jgi:acyl-CoA reductase-like NAD-dependent aldehyde dehydrogenase
MRVFKKFWTGCSLSQRFSSTEEAIAIASDMPYGLGCGCFGLVMLTNYSCLVLFKRIEFG